VLAAVFVSMGGVVFLNEMRGGSVIEEPNGNNCGIVAAYEDNSANVGITGAFEPFGNGGNGSEFCLFCECECESHENCYTDCDCLCGDNCLIQDEFYHVW
jgi:hypothetical protein